jgi:hypothetical protein
LPLSAFLQRHYLTKSTFLNIFPTLDHQPMRGISARVGGAGRNNRMAIPKKHAQVVALFHSTACYTPADPGGVNGWKRSLAARLRFFPQ